VLEKTPESPLDFIGLHIHWKDWCWSWSSSILAIGCKQTTHWKSPWCWERLRAEGEEGIRGWDSWMASPMQWTWTWANSGDAEGQGGLLCYSTRSLKQLDMTGWLNNNLGHLQQTHSQYNTQWWKAESLPTKFRNKRCPPYLFYSA